MCGGGYWDIKSKYSLIGKSVVLGVAAIWDRRKGLPDLIKAYKILPDDYCLIIVGQLENTDVLFPKDIIVINSTNCVEELVEIYGIADVFVNPTIEDNYPTTNIEAIACGTPVITYETGGSPESAKMYGVSVEKKNVEELVRAIENVDCVVARDIDIDYRNTVYKYVEQYKDSQKK